MYLWKVSNSLLTILLSTKVHVHVLFALLLCCLTLLASFFLLSLIKTFIHMQPTNINILTMSAVNTAAATCPVLNQAAAHIWETFGKALLLFAKCHNVYDQSAVTDAEIDTLGKHLLYMYITQNPHVCVVVFCLFHFGAEEDITAFMQYYQTHFSSASVTPKFHMLEEHVVPFLRQWKMALGFMGEQGAVNDLDRTYGNIPNMVDRLHRIMQEHHLKTAPSTSALIPAVKKRKISLE